MKKAFLALFLIVLMLVVVSAKELPPEAMTFYGKVTYTNGSAIPNGYYITAKIGTTVSAECEVINGNYGQGTLCIVLKPYEMKSALIEFFIGSTKIGSASFDLQADVNLNFTVETLPSNFTPLSNGICEPAKGECSYNLLDCDASKTSLCAGNGRCDVEIGETCTITSQDCTCQTPSSPSSSSSSSSGGGGGGGGSSRSSTSSSNTNNLVTLSTNSTEGENLNETSTENLDEENKKGITGFAVADFVKTKGGKISIGILILIILGLIFVSVKKDEKEKSKVKPKKTNGKKVKEIKVVKLSELKKRNKK